MHNSAHRQTEDIMHSITLRKRVVSITVRINIEIHVCRTVQNAVRGDPVV